MFFFAGSVTEMFYFFIFFVLCIKVILDLDPSIIPNAFSSHKYSFCAQTRLNGWNSENCFLLELKTKFNANNEWHILPFLHFWNRTMGCYTVQFLSPLYWNTCGLLIVWNNHGWHGRIRALISLRIRTYFRLLCGVGRTRKSHSYEN